MKSIKEIERQRTSNTVTTIIWGAPILYVVLGLLQIGLSIWAIRAYGHDPIPHHDIVEVARISKWISVSLLALSLIGALLQNFMCLFAAALELATFHHLVWVVNNPFCVNGVCGKLSNFDMQGFPLAIIAGTMVTLSILLLVVLGFLPDKKRSK